MADGSHATSSSAAEEIAYNIYNFTTTKRTGITVEKGKFKWSNGYESSKFYRIYI